jgi:hypothetical protein
MGRKRSHPKDRNRQKVAIMGETASFLLLRFRRRGLECYQL